MESGDYILSPQQSPACGELSGLCGLRPEHLSRHRDSAIDSTTLGVMGITISHGETMRDSHSGIGFYPENERIVPLVVHYRRDLAFRRNHPRLSPVINEIHTG